MKNHKKAISDGNSDFQKYVRENGGWIKVKQTIIHQWECADESEMFREEGKYIDEVFENPLCLNMKRAGITPRSLIGKLYKLTVGKTWIYFGKCRDVYHRMASHKTASKTKNTLLYKKIREYGEWDDCVEIETVREWECSETELKDAEDELIRTNWDNEHLLNSMPASTTPEIKRKLSNARVKRWAEAHPEEAKESAKKRSAHWREKNPEKVKEVQKRHREKAKNDIDRISYNKEYYAKHKDELNRKKREKRALTKSTIILDDPTVISHA